MSEDGYQDTQPQEEQPQEEQPQEEQQQEEQPQQQEAAAEAAKPRHQPTFEDDSGMNEAQIRMEEEKKKRMAKMEEEMREYEEMRKEEREKLASEIGELRAKREQRKQERAEEEKRLAEMRAIEEQKRRAEEEERQRRKREEEAKRKEEREKKRREAEERNKSQAQRNFTISKKSGGEASDAKAGMAGNVEAKEGKSKEQLEAERKAALEQRIQALSIDGFNEQQLQDKAKELFNKIYSLEGDKYDLEQRFKSQNMEMVELQERARQMQKGGQKGSSSKVQTAPDPLAEKLGGIPPKIVMYSQYERVKDHRGFGERQELFRGPMYGVEFERIKPTNKVVITEQGPRVIGDAEDNGEGEGEQPQEVAAEE